MTQQEIQERNKQIALMLGWEYIDEKVSYQNYGWWVKGTYHLDADARSNKNWIGFNSDIKFHSDWNWLHEAVEFIENIKDEQGYGNMINIWVNGCNVCENNAGYKIIENIFAPTKKEAVFIVVSDFAKLYNEKKL
jgi:hypothetical protein